MKLESLLQDKMNSVMFTWIRSFGISNEETRFHNTCNEEFRVKTQESILYGKNMNLCKTSNVGPTYKTLSWLNFYGCDTLLIYASS